MSSPTFGPLGDDTSWQVVSNHWNTPMLTGERDRRHIIDPVGQPMLHRRIDWWFGYPNLHQRKIWDRMNSVLQVLELE